VDALPTFISDQSHDHRVQVEEEHEQVESQLDERFLLMHVQFAENLGRVEEVLVFEDSATHSYQYPHPACLSVHLVSSRLVSNPREGCGDSLLRIPPQKRQVQQQRQPIPIDKEQNRQESVNAGFGDNVHVQAVAEVDRVNVVAFEIRVHDGEEDLEEKVHCIEQDRQEE
jgi:hypothetical protein